MAYAIKRFKIQIGFVILLACVIVSACQAPQPACCQLPYGLLRPADLDGKWDVAADTVQEISRHTTLISRYEQTPAAERARQFILGSTKSHEQIVTIVHDLRRYESAAPALARLDFKVFSDEGAGPAFEPEGVDLGYVSQASCQSSNPSIPEKSLTVCAVETRYRNLISIMFFTFDGTLHQTDMAGVINQALTKTSERIQTIDQHLNESSQ